MPARLELAAERRRIVDLAVADHDDGAVLVAERLMTALEVVDAETGHAHPERSVHEVSLVIGPAMHDGRAHAMERSVAHRRAVTVIELTDYAAHV